MVNVGSLPVVGNTLFDLDTQAGITAVLLAVRASQLAPSEKNELRDLIFLYTNGGKDQSVRLGLEQKIAASKLMPVTPKMSPATKREPKRNLPTIGTFRTAPSFAVPSEVAFQVPIKTVPPPVAPIMEAQPEPVSVSEPEPVKVAPLFSAQPAVTQPAEMSTLQDVVVPPVAMPKPDQQQYLDRIREIKSLVNEKVGNPVNLVDIDNQVGREYMSALLDAMKRINSGMSANDAMSRLEVAYVAVEDTLKKVAAAPLVIDNIPPPPQAVESQAAYVPPVMPEPVPVSVAPAPQSAYVPVMPAATPSVTPVSQYEPVSQAAPVYEPAFQYQSLAESVVPPTQHFDPVPEPPQSVVPTPNYNQAPITQSVPPAAHSSFSSLADMVQQSHAQEGLPVTPTTIAPLQSGDPLLAPQVEEGLAQLLSEWSIFKKSGIFGTGPKGKEHPLYLKMAELQIPLLLAGRFEGATQEVRQSLTDYMNGWRYEQGLIYEKGETFEHYLRRVIKHILEQNAR